MTRSIRARMCDYFVDKEGTSYYGFKHDGKLLSKNTDAAIVLQTLIDDVDVVGGGWIHVEGLGTTSPIFIGTPINLPESGNLILTGDGPQFTVFKVPVGSDNAIFQYTGVKTIASFFNRFQDFHLIGQESGTNNTGFLLDSTNFGLIDSVYDNVFVRDFGKDGFNMGGPSCWNTKIDRCTIEHCHRSGLYATVGGADLKIRGCKFLYNHTSTNEGALYLDGSDLADVTQNWFYGNDGHDIYLTNAADRNVIIANRFSENTRETTDTYDHIYAENAKYNQIIGNNFTGGATGKLTRFAINLQPDARDNIVTDNILLGQYMVGSIFLNNAGIGNIIRDNKGYSTIEGRYIPMGAAGTINTEGLLQGSISIMGTANASSIDTSGVFQNFDTGVTPNSQAGIKKTAYFVRREHNPYLKVTFGSTAFTPTSESRLFIGFFDLSNLPASDTFIGGSRNGIGFGYTSTDTNFRILHNDADAAGQISDDTGTPISNTVFSIEFQGSTSGFVWRLLNVGNTVQSSGLITTRIPSSTTNLLLHVVMQNTGSTGKTLGLRPVGINLRSRAVV